MPGCPWETSPLPPDGGGGATLRLFLSACVSGAYRRVLGPGQVRGGGVNP